MIIVEGPDGSGKTTLVNTLAEMFGLQIGKRGTENRDLLWTVTVPDTLRALGGAVHGKEPPIIWDRLYYSDFVYAPLSITPRDVSFNSSHQQHIDRILEALRCPLIVCLPSLATVRANVDTERHQMTGVRNNTVRIWSTYLGMCYIPDDAPKPFQEHRIVYDYTQGITALGEVLQEVEDYLEDREERQP